MPHPRSFDIPDTASSVAREERERRKQNTPEEPGTGLEAESMGNTDRIVTPMSAPRRRRYHGWVAKAQDLSTNTGPAHRSVLPSHDVVDFENDPRSRYEIARKSPASSSESDESHMPSGSSQPAGFEFVAMEEDLVDLPKNKAVSNAPREDFRSKDQDGWRQFQWVKLLFVDEYGQIVDIVDALQNPGSQCSTITESRAKKLGFKRDGARQPESVQTLQYTHGNPIELLGLHPAEVAARLQNNVWQMLNIKLHIVPDHPRSPLQSVVLGQDVLPQPGADCVVKLLRRSTRERLLAP